MFDREPGRLTRWLDRLRGRPIERDLTAFRHRLDRVDGFEPELASSTDATLASRFREAAASRTTELAVAVVREAARRTLGLRPYDEQVIAGMALLEGRIVEMHTGEGKTLAAVAPLAVRALERGGAHLLTFNDYLARRDRAWMGPVYRLLGLSVGLIQEGMSTDRRREAYAADVTYGTAKEIAFDTLRDSLVRDRSERVLRPFRYAIVDEADSILIDEARVPLVLAGEVAGRGDRAGTLAERIARLDPGTHFETDEHERNVHLTERGFAELEREIGCGSLIAPDNVELLSEIHCALHARVLLRRDVDYLVRGDRIELIDEFTGRTVRDRHLPDGLQAAVEAKEGLRVGRRGTVLASTTLQHFFARYPELAGMTATASAAAEELCEFYRLATVVIPPHRPSIRIDHPDVVFTHRAAKRRAVIAEIRTTHATGRPILVGTASVEESESLAADLRDAGVRCRVLNARNDEHEAAIVAEAGTFGAVTISTNMAGRGTDIRLGGRDERDRDRVVAAGGLYVLGMNRHESRRIDDQLRGRAGRQGDPGASRFFVSLEDPLISRYGVGRLIPERYRPPPGDDPIDHPAVLREIERAQRIVDGENVAIRRTLTSYSAMIEEQRGQIQKRREQVLEGASHWTSADAHVSARRDALRARWGRAAVERIEREFALACVDRAWSDHLAYVADLRDGIHLVRVARLDPLAEFHEAVVDAWSERWNALATEVAEAFRNVPVHDGIADLGAHGLGAPTSTWTYLVDDDPFRDKLMSTLTGTAMGLGIVANFPLVLAWWVYTRYFWNKRSRTSNDQARSGSDDRR